MSTCGRGTELRDGSCEIVGVTVVYGYSVILLLGIGAVAVGFSVLRKRRSAPPVGFDQVSAGHGRRTAEKIAYRAVPYFLMIWGFLFIVGWIGAMVQRLT
ncbi:hypothetical protein [Kitasatospora sp. NPDC087315]|uniref:hypothetical protein n=1 Tax=Kitasatospora sp. NPDC087315 TaxID=3364069 RepID=UPI00380E3E61